MSGSGGILEYQRELTAKLEQVMRERDEARAEVERLRGTLKALVERIKEVGEHPEYRAVWECAHLHRGPYRGPQYESEMNKARAALCTVAEARADLRTVAERQREACAAHMYRHAPSTYADTVRATPLVTEEKP